MSLKIDMTKIDEKIVDKYIADFNIKVKGGITAKVNALEKYQLETTPTDDMSGPCTKCGGESDFNLPQCPYCGDVDMGDMPNVEPVAEVTTEGVEAPAAPAPVTETTPPVEAPQVEVTTVKKQNLTRVTKPASPVVETTGELVTAKELDDAVESVHQALRQGATSYWDLGTALLVIWEKQLWKQRIEGGRQKFASWNLFCRDELAMSGANTFSIMDAAKAFSKKDMEDIGHSKLQLMLRLPKDRQQQLTEEAKKGRLTRARLKEIVEGETTKGAVRDTGRGKANNPRLSEATAKAAEKKREKTAAARRVAPPPDGEITAVSQLGRSKFKMYARPNVKKPNEKPSRAMSVTQDPWCEETLLNGVVVHYTVLKTATGFELHVDRKRPG